MGYRLTDERNGRTLVYLPGVQQLTPAVLDESGGCDCLLVDGTCWRDDEMVRPRPGRQDVPRHGPRADRRPGRQPRAALAAAHRRKIYIHINNTNPILLEDSPERRIVEDTAWR